MCTYMCIFVGKEWSFRMLKSVNVSTSLYDLKRIFTRGNITVHILHLFSKMYGRYSVFIRLSLYSNPS